jgi:glycosyltransferase involved in cell wall biosynthesis
MPLATQQGGAEALFRNLLHHRNLHLRYHCVFLQDGPLVAEMQQRGYPVTVLPTSHLRDLPNYLRTIAGLRRLFAREQPELIVSWMLKAHLYTAPAALGLSGKTVWFQHGLASGGWMERVAALLSSDDILCCSRHAKSAQDKLSPWRSSHVCYPGVDPHAGQAISQEVARAYLRLPAHGPVVGMVARWERWKGALLFLEAAKSVLATHPEATFFLVGGPHPLDLDYAAEVRAAVDDARLGERFRLAGQRPAEEIALWHASADLIAHPVTDAEPFGMSVVEAMMLGKVVIASDLGGPAEIIEDGVSGLLIRPSDPGKLSFAILRVLNDAGLRRRIAGNAGKRARIFSIDAFATRFEDLLTSTLTGNAPSHPRVRV